MVIRFICWRALSNETGLPVPVTARPIGGSWAPQRAAVETQPQVLPRNQSRKSMSNPCGPIFASDSAHERREIQGSGQPSAKDRGGTARWPHGQEHLLSDGRHWDERLLGVRY